MKKSQSKENSTKVYQIFLRFLKLHGVFYRFQSLHKKTCRLYNIPRLDLCHDTVYEIIKRYDMGTFRDVLYYTFLIDWSQDNSNLWQKLDSEWYSFYYKHKIYSKYIK